MDVSCSRCGTEYEFDDALISERGTTVRCTNCGLEFKIFPPSSAGRPELWDVWETEDRRGTPRTFRSLAELQRDISQGDVLGHHFLSRGQEEARRLSSIAELEPLLRRSRSTPPPPEVAVGAQGIRRGKSGTALGLPTISDMGTLLPPALALSDVRPPESPESLLHTQAPVTASPLGSPSESTLLSTHRSATPISVQSMSRPPEVPGGVESKGAESRKKRIHSALSLDDGAAPPAPAPDEAPASPRNQVPSLSQSLLPRGRGSVPPPSSDRPSSIPPPPSSERERVSDLPSASEFPEPLATTAVSSNPARQTAPPPLPQGAAPVEWVPVSHSSGPESCRSDPEVRASYPELGIGSSRDGAGSARGRGAKSGMLIGTVVLGAGLFAGYLGSEKIRAYVASPDNVRPAPTSQLKPKSPADASIPKGPAIELSREELEQKLLLAEIGWFRVRLLPEDAPDRMLSQTLVEKELPGWVEQASRLPKKGDTLWTQVDLLRLAGDVRTARSLLADVDVSEMRPYSVAMLDWAENELSPPWPSLLGRLDEARANDKSPFLISSAYLVALAKSGAVAEARAKWQDLGTMDGGAAAPLYRDLFVFFGRVEQAGSSLVEVPDVELSGAETGRTEWTPPPKDKSPSAPEEVKSLVDEADTLWRGGDRERAIVLYRQVMAKVGTRHFLGQRAAARIAQAERERGEGSPPAAP